MQRVNAWLPYFGGWYYVRVGNYVCKAYYDRGMGGILRGKHEQAGFYSGEGKDAEKINGVTAWIDKVIGLDAALHAREHEE